MRRLVLCLVLVFGIGTAYAEDPDPSEHPTSLNSLTVKEREREMQEQAWQGPSGMWTSPHKAKGGAYRYRMMGVGAILLVGMGYLVFRLIKKANAERAARG